MESPGGGIVLIIIGALVALFRKPFARSSIKSQNSTWGFRLGKKEIQQTERAMLLWGLFVLLWGINLTLGLPLNVVIDMSMQDLLGGIFAAAIGIAAIFFRETDDRYIMHFDGKPAIFRIGKMTINPLDFFVMSVSLVAIGTGGWRILHSLGWL